MQEGGGPGGPTPLGASGGCHLPPQAAAACARDWAQNR
jgi:hypothetical protein